jgi:malonyl-CoA decarboxylase
MLGSQDVLSNEGLGDGVSPSAPMTAAAKTSDNFLKSLVRSIYERGLRLIDGSRPPAEAHSLEGIQKLCSVLMSSHGEASGVRLATEVLDAWSRLEPADRIAFLEFLAGQFGPDHVALSRVARAYLDQPGDATARALLEAAEPARQELVRRLNAAPGAMLILVKMREEILRQIAAGRPLKDLDADFVHLFTSWFNRGFLILRKIDWSTSADILETIIKYEAVHKIGSWNELRLRVEPKDRRCFAFFHPQLIGEPLIFVEVALLPAIPADIAGLLSADRLPIQPETAKVAAFYSISNCQHGLRGISFGNFLIKQVVEELRRELPNIETFVTLSPIPGFARWLDGQRKSETGSLLTAAEQASLKLLDAPGWIEDPSARAVLDPILGPLAALYLTEAKQKNGYPLDPVARFHLGNGARLEQVNVMADRSKAGLAGSHGIMCNYLYDLATIEENHEAYVEKTLVATAPALDKVLQGRAEG